MELYFILALILGFAAGILLLRNLLHDTIAVLLSPLGADAACSPRRWLKKPITRKDYIEAYCNNTNFINSDGWERRIGANSEAKTVYRRIQSRNSGKLTQHKGGNSFMPRRQSLVGIELLKIPVVVGENTVQKMEISDVELDFAAQKIRHIDAKVANITYEVICNKVIIQGDIKKQLFYVGLDNIVHHQDELVHFSFFVDIPGARPGMKAQIHPRVEFVKPELIGGGNIVHQKVILEIFVKVTEARQMFLETASCGPLLKLKRVIGENAAQTLVEGSTILPGPAIKITGVDASIDGVVTEIIEDKVIVQGVIEKQIFYIGTDDIEHHFHESLPFSHFIDVPGAEKGMEVQLMPTIEYIEPILESDGQVLHQKVVVELFVKVTEAIQIRLALGGCLLIKVPQVIGEDTKQVLVENELSLDQPAIKIKEVLAEVLNLQTIVISDKVIIQGVIHKQIFYIGADNIEYHQAEDVPFSTFIDIQGARQGMDADVMPVIEYLHPEFSELGDLLHQKIILDIFVKVTEKVQLQVRPVEIVPGEQEEPCEPQDLCESPTS